MKKKLIKMASGMALVAASLALPSCNPESLTNLGQSTSAVNDLIPNYLFTSIVSSLGTGDNNSLQQGMQYTAYYKDVPDIGGKQYAYIGGPGFGFYTGKLNQITQLLEALPGAENVNKRAIPMIIKVWSAAPLTDDVGDIPYKEANQGSKGILKPKYDTQQEVYNQMFAELEAALTSIDASKPSYGSADVVYNGDLNKWKKFGYTLMLRLAMHISKKDPTVAKTWAAKAVAGGLMTLDADQAVYTKFSSTYTNGRAPFGEYSSTQDGDNAQGAKLSTTLINHFKATKDPRMGVLSVVWKFVSTGVYTADTNFAVQKGMIPGGVFGRPGSTTPGGDFNTYSEYTPLWWNRDGAPRMIFSTAEAYLLKAEAIATGIITGTVADEKTAYDAAVTSAMKFWRTYPNVSNGGFTFSGNITDAQIASYLLHGYPYNVAGTAAQRVEQISTQKWLSIIGDDNEVWTQWRRTGYPAFKFKNWSGTSGIAGNLAYPGSVTGGEMFRRLPYPDERATNNDNQQAALQRQGFPLAVNLTQSDFLLGRVWWDKP